jgi:transposase-like protein
MKVVHPGKPGQAVGQHTNRLDRRIARMNVHKNARLTPQGRLLLVRRITEEGWTVADAANAAGISVRQTYRWLARYGSGSAAALADRSSAPGCCKHRIGAERMSELTALRGQRMSEPAIARQFGTPVSTVGSILRGLARNAMS